MSTDGLRLAVGTLTAVRVPAPRVVDRRAARVAVLLAPAVGLAVGLAAELAAMAARWSIGNWGDRFVAAVVAVSALALLTRGLHLDGLADTVDGLASGRTGEAGVAVMRRSDVGPAGVVAVVLVLLLDVGGLVAAIQSGRGTLALVGGAVLARLALGWAARRRLPAASPPGLGSTFAGTIGPLALGTVTLSVAAALTVLTVLDDDLTVRFVPHTLAAALTALLVSDVLLRRCARRFGGVTGDVMGAAVEVAFCVFVLGIAVG